MFSFVVNDKEYKIQYGYRVLCETNLLDKITQNAEKPSESIATVAELILHGLTKNHPEFKFDTETSKKKAMAKVYDLMDEYEKEGGNCFDLGSGLQEELMKNGFLSKAIALMTAEAKK